MPYHCGNLTTVEDGAVTDPADSRHAVDSWITAVGAALAGLAVALGAFGAHALRGSIASEALDWWKTGVEYQMWHALAVLALGLSSLDGARLSAWLLAGGTVVFSGTLYAMALGAPHWLGAVTPIGGVTMICGWALLVWRAAPRPR
jgi:uncharacterized membrane protein YgdD (TMEM256/DUF423 family)